VRFVVLATVVVVLLAAAYAAFVAIDAAEVPIPALVPEDARFVVVYRSVNDLRDAFRGRHVPQREDPARRLLGSPTNNPDLDGVAFDRPAARYLTREMQEVILLPVANFDLFEEAFDRNRESLRLRRPVRVGAYVSVSASSARARRGPDHPDVVEALEAPYGAIVAEADPKVLRLTLPRLLALEEADARALPDAVFGFLARECRRIVLRAHPGADEGEAGRLAFTLRTSPGAIERAAKAAEGLDAAALAACFPAETLLLLSGALAAPEWDALLPDLQLGDAAAAAGIVRTTEGRRPYALLVAVRPAEEARLRALDASAASLFWPDPGAPIPFETADDSGTVIRAAPLPAPPFALAQILRDDSGTAPPVRVALATERGVFFLAVGSRAESVVRRALAHLRGDRAASLFALGPVAAHARLLEPGAAFLGVALEEGLRALGASMPLVGVTDIGKPVAATLRARFDGALRVDVRLSR
jgi:hypothetical protein